MGTHLEVTVLRMRRFRSSRRLRRYLCPLCPRDLQYTLGGHDVHTLRSSLLTTGTAVTRAANPHASTLTAAHTSDHATTHEPYRCLYGTSSARPHIAERTLSADLDPTVTLYYRPNSYTVPILIDIQVK